MTNKYRVGLIGRTGKGDYGHGVDTVWKEIDRAELVAVADENEKGRMLAQERTGAKATYSDYRKMLESEKLDILAIGPRWIDQHHEMLIAAAD
ncbi:MAG: Gfo/Idh/MocA family oxidoreductase, partial [Planctomyces sp.]